MITVKRLWSPVLAAVAILAIAGSASAQISSERPGSILIFPKVINDGTATTRIQITNTTNGTTYAHCYYVNGATISGRPSWQLTDFDLALTRAQPTQWDAGTGRPTNPGDGIAGLDPGPVPPVSVGFTGELICIEVDASGVPLGGNHLIGLASVNQTDGSGNSMYNATGIPAINGPDPGPLTAYELELDNDEYSACPAGYNLDFIAQGSTDDVLSGLGIVGSANNTALTFVPCDADFENIIPGSVSISIEVRNEFEQVLSTPPVNVDCWATINLDDIRLGGALGPMTAAGLGTTYGHARLRSVAGNGFLLVANRSTISAAGNSTAAVNPHFFGNTAATNLGNPGATIRSTPH